MQQTLWDSTRFWVKTSHLLQDLSSCFQKEQACFQKETTTPSNHQGACMPLQLTLSSESNEGGLKYKRLLACLGSCMGQMHVQDVDLDTEAQSTNMAPHCNQAQQATES